MGGTSGQGDSSESSGVQKTGAMEPMARLAQSTNTSGNGSRTGQGSSTGSPLDEEDLWVKLRAYLECRCCNVDPPPPLAEAWDRFYDLYAPRMRAFLRRFGLPEADREDCLQDVWSKVLTRLAALPYDPRRARLSTWLLTVARNQAVDALHLRRRCADPIEDPAAIVDSGPGSAADCDPLSTQERVRIVLTELSAEIPALNFQVLYLRTIEGCTTAEVAVTLGLTPEQVRFRLHRAKRKFRDLFEHSVDPDHSAGEGGPPRDAERNFSRNTAGPRAYKK